MIRHGEAGCDAMGVSMAAICEHYKTKTTKSRKKGAGLFGNSATETIEVSWCSHRLSPVSKNLAFNVNRGGKKLKCEGDVTRCPIAEVRVQKWPGPIRLFGQRK